MTNEKETTAQIAERILRKTKDDAPIPVLLDVVDKTLPEAVEDEKSKHEMFDSENFKRGDFLVAYADGYSKIYVFVNMRENLSVKDIHSGIPVYFYCFLDPMELPDCRCDTILYLPKDIVRLRHASENEKGYIFKTLKYAGLEWNAEECRIVKSGWEPKEGDFVYTPYCGFHSGKFKVVRSFWNARAELGRRDWVFRTEAEAQELCNRLNELIGVTVQPKNNSTHNRVLSRDEIKLIVEDMLNKTSAPAIVPKDLIDIDCIFNSTAGSEFKICDTPPVISISEKERMKIAKKYGLDLRETKEE